MYYLKKLNDNYFIYFILIFVFFPLNYIPQLFDGVYISYSIETKNLENIDFWYKDASRYVHFFITYLINIFTTNTSISAEIFLDNLTVLILILFCIEVKKYSKLLFGLEDRWCNLAALFTAIFPVWHTFVSFNVAQYLISIYFLLFGYRNFIKRKKFKILIGLIFIILAFDVESNLSFIVGLALINLILNKSNELNDNSISKLFNIIIICIVYYLLKISYIPTTGYFEGYNKLGWGLVSNNFLPSILFSNILNYSTYLLLFIWIPLIFYLNILIKNKFLKINVSFKFINNYFFLIILSAFATFPYLLVNKSSSIFYLADYYQRHAFLLAPISGIFFAIMFKDMSKINIFQNKVNLKIYLIIFIFINLILLNYGNLRKTESYHFRKNLISELKEYGSIPKGDVQIISKNLPADIRNAEVSYIFYKAYNLAGWWGITAEELKKDFSPPYINGKSIVMDEKYSTLNIVNDYSLECKSYIFLKNDLKKIDRLKKFYVINYRKYYKIDKILKKC